jgi:hypothetical protein
VACLSVTYRRRIQCCPKNQYLKKRVSVARVTYRVLRIRLLCDWLTGRLADCPQQESRVKELLSQGLGLFNWLLLLEAMHTAALQPGRMAAWLEGAAKMPVAKPCEELVERFLELVKHQRPARFAPAVQGMVSAAQWKEGAAQLRREVSHCL